MPNQSIAFVFPGQGSQSVGMMHEFAQRFPEIKDTFAQASAVLGYDLWELVENGAAEKLDQTIYTQPALLAASYALWRVVKTKTDIQPNFLAGHSLGEYTALVCAEAIAYEDAIKLVAARGQYMQEAVGAGIGAMAAIIGLENEAVEALCAQARTAQEVLTPANYNSVGQVVIAGHKTAVERAVSLAKEAGAKIAVILPVSVPSHCTLMLPAAERLAKLLSTLTLRLPKIPVINNTDATVYTDVTSIKDGLVRQLSMPVRWVEIIQFMIKNGVETVVECGPGKVLTGLNKRIDKRLQLKTVEQMMQDQGEGN